MYWIPGIALVAVGVALLAMGVTASESFGSEVSTFFSGRPTERTRWLLLSGGASIIVGAVAMVAARRAPHRA